MRFFFTLILISLFLPSPVQASEAPRQENNGFHKAQTASETILDAVLTAETSSDFFLSPVYKRPGDKNTKDEHALHLLSRKLISTLYAAEQKMLRKNCDGHYKNGEICGLDFSPLLCGQDASQKGYLFQTKRTSNDYAEILSIWAEEPTDTSRPVRYLLVRDSGKWKVDGIECGENLKFNIR